MEDSNRQPARLVVRGLGQARGVGQFISRYGTYVFFVALIALTLNV